MFNILAIVLLQAASIVSSASANHVASFAPVPVISFDGGTSGWGGDIALGGTSGWGGDIALGGTSGWGGDIA